MIYYFQVSMDILLLYQLSPLLSLLKPNLKKRLTQRKLFSLLLDILPTPMATLLYLMVPYPIY